MILLLIFSTQKMRYDINPNSDLPQLYVIIF